MLILVYVERNCGLSMMALLGVIVASKNIGIKLM